MSFVFLYIFFWLITLAFIYNLPLILYGITYEQISAIKNDEITTSLSEIIKNLGLTDTSLNESINQIEQTCTIISIIIIVVGIILTILTIKNLSNLDKIRSELINEYKKRKQSENR